MDAKAKRIIKKQLAHARAAADHLRDAAKCARKAKIDTLPEDLESQATSLDELASTMEEKMNPPKAEVIYIADHMPIAG